MIESKLNANFKNEPYADIEPMYQPFMAVNELLRTCNHALELASHNTGAENCSVMLINGHRMLYLLNSFGESWVNIKASEIKLGEGIAGQVAADGHPLLVEDISSDARFSVLKRDRYKTGSFIVCPIVSMDKVIGVLNLADKNDGRSFNDDDLRQVQSIAVLVKKNIESFLVNCQLNKENQGATEIYHRLIEELWNKREFIVRISHILNEHLEHIKNNLDKIKCKYNLKENNDINYFNIIYRELYIILEYIKNNTVNNDNIKDLLCFYEEKEKYNKL